jgi:hypothetical protein
MIKRAALSRGLRTTAVEHNSRAGAKSQSNIP